MKLYSNTIIALCSFLLISHHAISQNIGTLNTQKPIKFNGGLQLRSIYYSSPNNTLSNRFSYLLSGSPTLSIYGLSVPVSFTFSDRGNSFQQPFNQYGLSPNYKWATIHLGYRNIMLSPYTLAGITMFGVGVELTPGKFRFAFMYGNMNRATVLDTASQSLVPYSFDRKGYAIKLGIGTDREYFDIHFLKAKDDSSSIPYKQFNSSSPNVITPAANTIAGLSLRTNISKHVFAEFNGAISLYTRDINSPLTFSDSSNALFNAMNKIMPINGSSDYSTALDGAIGYSGKACSLKIQYSRIDPNYQSMGAYFFNNDVERYAFAPSLNLFRSRLRLGGSVGLQHDNVKDQKQSTTKKITANGNLTADIGKHLGLDVNYTNFSNNQQPKALLFADSIKITQTTQTMLFSVRYFTTGTTITQSIVAAMNLMQLNDFNNYFAQNAISRNMDFKQYYINYSLSNIPQQLSFNINFSNSVNEAGGIQNNNVGATAGFNKSLFKSKLSVNASAGYFVNESGTSRTNTFNASANVNYVFLKKHGLNALFAYSNNIPKNAAAVTAAFSETRAELAYSFTF